MNRISFLAAILLSIGLLQPAFAQDAVGQVVALEGNADVTRGEADAISLDLNDEVFREDTVRTKSGAFLEIELSDGSRFTLDESTRVEISQYVTDPEADGLLSMARGRLRATVGRTFSSRRESFRVETSDAVMGVQGTDFLVTALPDRTDVLVYEGLVSVTSLDPDYSGATLLRAGQFTSVRPGQPIPQPRDYYPINDATRDEGTAMGSGSDQDVQSGGTQVQDPTTTLPTEDMPTVTVPPTPNPPDGDGGG